MKTSAASIPVTGFGLDSHEAIGLVTSATASIMAGSRLVRWEICGAMPGLPGLTPHAYMPIDSNTGHVRVRVETEADKEYCKTECCRHHTGRQPAWHANEWQLWGLTCGYFFRGPNLNWAHDSVVISLDIYHILGLYSLGFSQSSRQSPCTR